MIDTLITAFFISNILVSTVFVLFIIIHMLILAVSKSMRQHFAESYYYEKLDEESRQDSIYTFILTIVEENGEAKIVELNYLAYMLVFGSLAVLGTLIGPFVGFSILCYKVLK